MSNMCPEREQGGRRPQDRGSNWRRADNTTGNTSSGKPPPYMPKRANHRQTDATVDKGSEDGEADAGGPSSVAEDRQEAATRSLRANQGRQSADADGHKVGREATEEGEDMACLRALLGRMKESEVEKAISMITMQDF